MSMVRTLRKAMRRNRQQLGMFFGVSRETVRAWENGRAVPPETVREFAGRWNDEAGAQSKLPAI